MVSKAAVLCLCKAAALCLCKALVEFKQLLRYVNRCCSTPQVNRATRQISRRRADVQRLPARLLIVTLVSPACCVVLVTVFSFSKDRSRRSSPVAAHARSSTVASRQGRSRKGGQQGGDGALRLLESCHASRQPELAGRCAHCLRRAFSCGSVQLRRGPHLLLPGLSVHWAMSVPCLRDSSLAPATRFPQNIG